MSSQGLGKELGDVRMVDEMKIIKNERCHYLYRESACHQILQSSTFLCDPTNLILEPRVANRFLWTKETDNSRLILQCRRVISCLID